MNGLALSLALTRRRTGDPLGRYALIDGGVSHRPIAVFSADVQAAWRRILGVEDFQLVDDGTNRTPLAVFSADNQIAVRG